MKPGATIIQELRKGECNTALGEAINEATERVKATGKRCTVTLTLEIEPVDDKATTQAVERVFVTDKIKTKLAALPQKNTLFFIDPDSSDLSRTDPQQTVPGVKVDKPAPERAAG